MTLSNFMKCMDSVKRPKKSGNEHTKSHLPTEATEVEATEGRNEAKEAEATVTNEAVGNETEAIPQSAIETEAASTSTAIETEAKLVAQPAVQSEVSSDVNSSELVNPEGNLFDVFASAKEIDIEIKTHKDHNRYQVVSNGVALNISSKSRKKLPKPAIKVEAFDKSDATMYKKANRNN